MFDKGEIVRNGAALHIDQGIAVTSPKISEFPVWRSELPAGSEKFLKNGGISVGSARFWYSKVQIRVGLIYITVLLNVRVRLSRRFAARQGRALRLESHIVPAATA
jgi:hypothetical protein